MSTEAPLNRIKQLRLARAMSLDDLADTMGGIVTKQALSKYELGHSTPSASVLNQLAAALKVKAMDLWAPPAIQVNFQGYRKRASLPKKWQASFEALVCTKLQERLPLQEYCYSAVPFDLPVHGFPVKTEADAEDAAETLRDRWKLGVDSIGDLTAVLEDHLVHVLEMEGPEKFDGISALVRDPAGKLRAAAVVSRVGCPGDRQRLNLAHELGHLVMKPAAQVDEEKAAFRFAGAFLAPRACIEREIGTKRTTLRLGELLILKRRFGMSVQALLRRLFDLETITDSYYRWWCIYINKMHWRTQEPEPLPSEKPSWFRQTVLRCLAEGFVSVAEAEKLLGEKIESEAGPGMLRRRSFLKLPMEERRRILAAQAERLQKHYESDRDGWEKIESDDFDEHK
jgi:transcriptional regulator with XRE-family HTH domain